MPEEFAEYCRQLESHLCRRNGGHLIRIVGPVFEQVRGWAEQGIPLKIALRGIDRYCERREAKPGPRRRPVRIEFCEADILELFDDWRRAIGVAADARPRAARKPSLSAHLERAIPRLTAVRTGDRPPCFVEQLGRAIEVLDAIAARARRARGAERAAMIERLAALDRELIATGEAALDPSASARLTREAEEELGPLGARMTTEARAAALSAMRQRLLREALGLPTLAYD